MFLAFCLDVGLRAVESDGLDVVMRRLQNLARERRQALTFEEIAETVRKIGGTQLETLLRVAVNMTGGVVPVAQCLAEAGLVGHFQPYAAEIWITKRTNGSPILDAIAPLTTDR